MSGTIPLFSLYAFVAWRGKTLYPPRRLVRPRHKIDDNIKKIGLKGTGLGMKCCERGDELSGCVKCCTFLDSLRSYSI
jgi:hypothetical protein